MKKRDAGAGPIVDAQCTWWLNSKVSVCVKRGAATSPRGPEWPTTLLLEPSPHSVEKEFAKEK